MAELAPADDWWERPLWAEIDLDALAQNIRGLKERAQGALMTAVVKANAYGHGAQAVGRAALAAGADRLAVVNVDEGQQLRAAGITAPILVLGPFPLSDARRIVELGLTPTVNSLEMALALAQAAAREGVAQPIHLKVDTGLARYGLPPREVIALAESLREVPALAVEGLFTHFATADEGEKTYTRQQYKAFLAVAQRLPWIPLRHVSNTATILDMPEMSLDLVRPGIGIYGYYPSPQVSRSVPLRPILSLKSRVTRLTRLAPGQSVSYGRTWRAQRASLIALAVCGYGDGLPRALSNRGSVLIRGRRAPIVGRVCMDMCMIDVTDLPKVALGDEIVFIGRQGEEEIGADEVADLCATISYEILCGLAARVPRLYLQGGQVMAVETLASGLRETSGVGAN